MSFARFKGPTAQVGLLADFDRLVEEHQKRVYNVCLRMMRNPQDAMDMTQETFLKAWRAKDSFMGQSSVSTWLHRVAVNACLDELRRQKKRTAVSMQELSESGWEPADEHTGDFASRIIDQTAVNAALDLLPSDHRTVLILRDMEGYSYEELAAAMHCPVGTVRSRLNRARANMMKILTAMEQNVPADVKISKGGRSDEQPS